MGRIALLLCVLLAVTQGKPSSKPSSTKNKTTAAPRTPDQMSKDFGIDLFKKVHAGESNYVISPAAAKAALLVCLAGAEGTSATEIAKVLGMEDTCMDTIRKKYNEIMSTFSGSHGSVMTIKNSLWVDQKCKLRKSFKKDMQGFDSCDVRSTDFEENPHQATEDMNAWTKTSTNNLISEVSDEDLSAGNVVVPVSAVYMNAHLASGFKSNNSYVGPFTGIDGKVSKVLFMKQEGPFIVGESKEMGARYLIMDFAGDDSAMLIMTATKGSISQVCKKMCFSRIRDCFVRGKKKMVEVSMPKLYLTSNMGLDHPLSHLKVLEMFEEGQKFSNMTDAPESHVSDMIQQTCVAVDEDGDTPPPTDTSKMEKATYKMDAPFVMIAMHKMTSEMPMVARVNRLPSFE